MDALTKLNEFHKQDDELLLANINHELLSGTFGISRIQNVLRIGYNQAAHLVDRSIENGILVRPDDYPHMARFSDKIRKKMDIKMENLPIINNLISLSEAIEKEFHEKVKIGMSQEGVFDAVEEIENFPYEELEHVIKNIFTWGKPLEESSLYTLKNEYLTVLKRELLRVIESQILLEDYSH